MRLWPALLLILLSSPHTFAQAQMPFAMDSYSVAQHLLPHHPVENPTASSAQPVYGVVNLAVSIDPKGHVTHIETLNGPPQLVRPATAAVKGWTYTPFEKDGKPMLISTIVTVTFPAPGQLEDAEVSAMWPPLMQACRDARSTGDISQRVLACTKAASVADNFASGSRYIERRSAYIAAANALWWDQKFHEALGYANKAVGAVKQDHDDGPGAVDAYSARAKVEAKLGMFDAADQDISIAEDEQRVIIKRMMESPDWDVIRSDFIPTLKALLAFDAQMLTEQGNTSAAQAKSDEAAKLK